MLEQYVRQVRLLLSVLPDIARKPVFALKDGTAINLFYRDMTRVSVDIDLTYLPVADCESSLENIDTSLDRIAQAITVRNPRGKAQRIAGRGINDSYDSGVGRRTSQPRLHLGAERFEQLHGAAEIEGQRAPALRLGDGWVQALAGSLAAFRLLPAASRSASCGNASRQRWATAWRSGVLAA